ncbi:phosphomannomutase [Solimonas aquatica]|uniref:phosphomannomutase n=1 Tax=Solimonas aquatica TaxID=489703 RepID=A0A1H9BWC2_9GAMM|nr:phosphomannomutase [Solimonas aquatica]SEP93127.1 phosphomannomutase [Solimonas aquatica]
MSCFKAYDLRGRVPDELNPDIAFRLGCAFADEFSPAKVALGRDIRHSSQPLLNALAHGLLSRGVEVLDLGLCGTEEMYWAAQQPGIDGAIEVTASHNPMDYNGMKLVRGGAVPVSGDSGLRALEQRVNGMTDKAPTTPPAMKALDLRDSYVRHLLGYIDPAKLKPLRIVVNAGNGVAGKIVDALAPHLPFEFLRVHHQPDGNFPNGIPNPLLPEMRQDTIDAVRNNKADFGVAWDGDFDRCFFFDEQGQFIEGYYVVGLLAQALLLKAPGSKIIHDPRLTWNTIDIVKSAGGVPIQSKTGHAFIKERMRLEDALYGGEMSAHHYFRDFAYCDNGNIPWLLVAQLISVAGQPLSALVSARMQAFPASGEINRKVADVKTTIEAVHQRFARNAQVEWTDGLSADFGDWRFNLRGSNTEPVLRLNVESRGDSALMAARTQELLDFIDAANPQ